MAARVVARIPKIANRQESRMMIVPFDVEGVERALLPAAFEFASRIVNGN
jgi:hypothetical protein